jgi:type I restriction enzyme S subunit
VTFTEAIAHPTAPLGYLAKVFPSGVDKKTVDGEQPVRLCNYTDVYYRDRITSDIAFMEATATEAEVARFTLLPGDVVITKDSETADDIAIPALVTEDLGGVVLGYHSALIRPDTSKLDPRFLFWALMGRRSASYFETKARGVTRVGLRADDMAAVPVPMPPLQVQRRVADMLDDETTRIDTLIAKNNEVLRLSDLRREATISLYVSGGMDARDPVEAFVEQPAMKHGWELTKLKYVAQGVTVGIVVRPAELYVDSPEEGVPCLRGVNVKRGRVVDTDLRFIGHAGNAANPKSQLRRGDVVVVRTGEAGAAAVVPEWALGGNCVDLLLVRTGPRLDPTFAEFVLNSDFVRRQVARGSVGSIQSHFNVASLSEAIIAVPEIEQQRMIVADLQDRLAPLRRLREKVERQVELLNMRRRALITAAVTGEINV